MAYAWPNTPESGRGYAGLSNVTASNTLVNGFLRLGRTLFGTVEVIGLADRVEGKEGRMQRIGSVFTMRTLTVLLLLSVLCPC